MSRDGVVVQHNKRDAVNCMVKYGQSTLLKDLKLRRLLQLQQAIRLRQIHWQHDYSHLDTFHSAMKPYIYFANIFGIMPLVNTLNANPQRLQFRFVSLSVLVSAVFFVLAMLKTLEHTATMLRTGIHLKNMAHLVFPYITLTIFGLFFSLGRHWPTLIRYWTRAEIKFLIPPYTNYYNSNNNDNNNYSYTQNKRLNNLPRQMRVLACSLGAIALVEHTLYHASQFYNAHMTVKLCHANKTHATFKDYMLKEYEAVFTYFPYHPLLGAYALFFNLNFTVVWNFLDVFLMLVSLGLANRFQKFAAHVERLYDRDGFPYAKYVPDAVWYAVRKDHLQLCELLEAVNGYLSNFVLISCLNNTYFICNQLLNIFTKLRWPINYVYFWFSLGFLLLRTIGVFLCAAEIHDASVLPLKALYLIPSGGWTQEVQRFTAQITQESIGLSGKRFYLLVAAIVTYEFILLQFDAASRKAGLPSLCGTK